MGLLVIITIIGGENKEWGGKNFCGFPAVRTIFSCGKAFAVIYCLVGKMRRRRHYEMEAEI